MPTTLRPEGKPIDDEISRKLERLAHGIRTPLHAVLGSAELLRDDIDNPSHVAHLATIIQAAETALTCLDGALKELRVGRVSLSEPSFTLPERRATPERTPAHSVTPTSDSKRVLVVDDNRVSCLLTQEMLERSGYTVKTAADGREGLNLFRSRDFDLVLLDLEMPIMDGFEAYAKMRDEDATRGKTTPIIALTAESSQGVFDRASHDGFDAFLLKPLARSELLSAVKKHLDGRGK